MHNEMIILTTEIPLFFIFQKSNKFCWNGKVPFFASFSKDEISNPLTQKRNKSFLKTLKTFSYLQYSIDNFVARKKDMLGSEK